MRVLAIGATGQYAGLVVPTLAERGLHVRALVHDPAKLDRARAAGAEESTREQIADLMSRHAGRTVTAQELPVSLVLRSILDRAPRSLDDYFAELAR